jgi:ferredoxin-NADP reductase
MLADAPLRMPDLTRLFHAVSGGLARRALPVLDRASARFSVELPLLEAGLAKLDATLSLCAVRARVVEITDETPDTKTYWLRPNARFGSHRPGSYVTLRVRIDGRIVQRNYSICTAPRRDGLIAITVKRVSGGTVSNWIADTLQPGHVVELTAAQGQFVLPDEPPRRLLLLSAGSGITPVMALLRQLTAAKARCEIVFLHFARTPHDVIFRRELERIARDHANVQLELCVEAAGGESSWAGHRGRFSQQLLEAVAPDFRVLDTYLCGPSGFMQTVMQTLERSGADLVKLRYERFNTELDASLFLEHAHVLRFSRSNTEALSNRPRTILEEAEGAGLRVASGCRAGNCGTCRCRKTRGVVVDITTGRESGAGDEFIYPCISVARGTVEIDL